VTDPHPTLPFSRGGLILAAILILLLLAACGPANANNRECVIAGCSQQLCISKEEQANTGGVSTCEYTPAYGCYSRVGRCEKQKTGKCGWTKSYDLQQCLKNPEGFTGFYDKRDRMDREIDRTRNQIIDGTIR